ncbi:amidohydrolase family protein [Xylophilus rhododendri]|uniref:Amidohydrolase family protein n=1 Tax=Xylophilus rhododendri TaxID=2697032 RepID=A0A857J3N9_9BURK|nr:amidohydrolase family protein [Xylophilus rhododendri]QHI98544.1 amidohydrolase family protein [Xylophilus rhododendri]
MNANQIDTPVPHSVGLNRPAVQVPPNACDSHMHIFDPRFAPSPHWTRTPPVADVAIYRRLQQRLGTRRTVVVTPSTYGIDNRCTLDALAAFGEQARGVAVVPQEVGEAELQSLAEQRVRGLRVNFVTAQSWGTTTPRMLQTLAAKVAPLGWHIQVFAHAAQLMELLPVLQGLPVPLVIDHMGRIDAAIGVDSDAFRAVRGLLDAGNTWMKLSGAYMESTAGGPTYADRDAVGRALLEAAPERMVWGSDWPHTTQPKESVNDADLLELLRRWCPSQAVFERILVDNPQALYGF